MPRSVDYSRCYSSSILRQSDMSPSLNLLGEIQKSFIKAHKNQVQKQKCKIYTFARVMKVENFSQQKYESDCLITYFQKDQILKFGQLKSFYSYFNLYKVNKLMHFSSENLRLSSPISSQKKIFKDGNNMDEQYLYHRLNAVLFTLQAEKQDFEQKFASEKKILEQKMVLQQEKIKELQTKNQKAEQECRQLRFNYHQRGSVVDYLKKKITIIQNKFNSEKQEMMSVIKYLEGRNYQLNQVIFQLKKKELEQGQNLFNLQQKYFNLSNEFCKQNTNGKQLLRAHQVNNKKPLERKSLCHKHDGSLTPQYLNNKYRSNKDEKNFSSRQNNIGNFNLFEEQNGDSLGESSVRQKTIKYEAINRVKSEDQFDFTRLNNRASLKDYDNSKGREIRQIRGKGILINNYGHLSFTDCPTQFHRKSDIKKQNTSSRPKLSLPNHGRFAQLITERGLKHN